MEINNRTKSILRAIFSHGPHEPNWTMGAMREINYQDNNVFNRFWQIDVTQEKIEFPVFFTGIINTYGRSHLFVDQSVEKISLPIYVAGGDTLRRTGDALINVGMLNSRIIKIITNKGEIYYIGRGIAFDENFQILILCTRTLKISSGSSAGITYGNDFGDFKCYINPSLFSREDLFSKTILKKIVPFYLEDTKECEVVIKDMTKELIIPSVPDINTFSQESINNFLKENIAEITKGTLLTKYL